MICAHLNGRLAKKPLRLSAVTLCSLSDVCNPCIKMTSCVEGRLMLTQFLKGKELLYLAEILASDVILLTEPTNKRSQEE